MATNENETPVYGRPAPVPDDGHEVQYVVEGPGEVLATGSALQDEDLLADFAESYDDLVEDIFLEITGRRGSRRWFLRYRPVVGDGLVKQYQRVARSGKSGGSTGDDLNALKANLFLLKATNTGIFVDGFDDDHQLVNESGRPSVVADPWFWKTIGKPNVDAVLRHILGDVQVNTHAKAILLAAGLNDQAEPASPDELGGRLDPTGE